MLDTKAPLKWAFEELQTAAYRVSRRREAYWWTGIDLTLGIIMLASSLGLLGPEYAPIPLAAASLLFLQDAVYEFLWPTRFVRLRAFLIGLLFFPAAASFRYPEYVPDSPYLSGFLIMGAAIYAPLFFIAIARWPVRRTTEQLEMDEWIARNRKDNSKANLAEREDVIGVSTRCGKMRMKKLGDYVLIGHGLEQRCEMAHIALIQVNPMEAVKDVGRTTVTYKCGRYEGKGKTTRECLDRLQRWTSEVAEPCEEQKHVYRKRIGHFRIFEGDEKDSWISNVNA